MSDTATSELILVVEDEIELRGATVTALERSGYTAVGVSDGYQAIQYFRKHTLEIILVIIDLGLPGLNGRETLDELRKLGLTTPALITTGYLLHEDLAQIKASKTCGFLAKPYTPAEIRSAVDDLLNEQARSM